MIKNLRVSLSLTLVMLAICMFAPRTSLAVNITSTATGGNWSVGATWAGGAVPGTADDVTIANGATVTIDGSVSCANLTVGQGANGILTFDGTARTFTVNGSVTVATGASFNAGTANITHTVKIGGSANNDPYTGNLTVNGTLNFYVGASNGKANITFFGLPNALISGTTGTINFNTGNILNKGAVTATASVTPPVLDIQRTFTVQGANTLGFLTTHTAGVLKIGGTFPGSNPLYATATYSIPKLGGLWLDNPNFTIIGLNGSPFNSGLLKISNGTYNIGTSSGNVMLGKTATAAVFIFEGGTTNIASQLNETFACTLIITGGTINVTTVGNSSGTAGFGFTFATNTVSITGGTINLVQRSSISNPFDYNVLGTVPTITGGTLNVGTAATATRYDFGISGYVPNLVIDNTTNIKTLTLRGATTVYGTATLNTGTTFVLNDFSCTLRSSIINNGTIDARRMNAGPTHALIFQGSAPQTLDGNINSSEIENLIVDNPAGVTIIPEINIIYSLTLTSGALTFAGATTFGDGGASLYFPFTFTKTNGDFNGTVYTYYGPSLVNQFIYNGTSPQTTGLELPSGDYGSTIASGKLTIDNAAGVVLNSPLNIPSLTLSAGALITSSTNLLTITGTTPASVTRTNGYVNGPLARSLPSSLTTGKTYLWPLGKFAYTPFELVNPITNSGGTVDIQAEVFDTNNGGTAGSGLGNLNDRHWESSITTNSSNFISTTVRVTDETAIPALSVLGRSATKTGIYNPFGNTIIGSTILSNSLSELGFFAIGTIAACNNPISGGTIAEDQSGCGSFDPNSITNIELPGGEPETLEYKWQYSVSPFNIWTDINSDTEAYDPGLITETTKYKRLARVDCKTSWAGAAESNVVTKSVVISTLIDPGVTIDVSQNPVCAETNVTFKATPSGLEDYSGPLAYEWFVNRVLQLGYDQNTFDYYPLAGDQVYVVMGGFTCTVHGNTTIQSANTITMAVNEASSAVISSGDVTICSGASTDLTIELTGTGPWDVTYTDGSFDEFYNPILFYENNIISSPHTITVAPGSTATYTLMTVTGANLCTYPIYSSATVYIDPLPSAITGSATFSPGDTEVTYSIDPMANATDYTWSYSGTGVILTETENIVSLDFAADATSGTLSVFVTNACGHVTTSSLYILSIMDKLLDIKVFLEGAYDTETGQLKTTLNTSSLVPLAHPYSGAPWNVAAAPASSIPANVVDWVLVELRTAAIPALALSGTAIPGWPKAFFLKTDGTIVDLDGTSLPNIGNPTINGNLYVIVRHRNHLAIMSATGATLNAGVYSYDFTTALTQVYGGESGYKQVGSGVFGMVAGDINHDGNVFVTDYNVWAVQFGLTNTYSNSDLDQDGNIFVTDYNKWAVNFGNTTTDPTLLKSGELKPRYFSCVPQ